MKRPAPIVLSVTLAVAATAAGCTPSGGPSPAGTLGYGLPAPPSAVYEIADTTQVTVTTPTGKLESAGGYALTLDLGFEMHPAGVRVRGIVDEIEGSMWNPGAPSRRPRPIGSPAETHDFVIDRRGVVVVRSFPTLSDEAALLFSFAGHAHDLFPRLPDSVVDPGATWPDTVRWHVDLPQTEVTYRAILTHTLVGDTIPDGRPLLQIAVAGTLDNVTVTGVAGAATYRVLKGPVTGLVLWDPERRLVVWAEYERSLTGMLQRPDRQVLEMSLEGRVSLRLEG
ncbi:MAG: hypothetical protein OXH49_13540 [Gemmatimonadetes bacterium]|nr:hypothetical protein [Gemmatimonadota bacterium]